LFFATIAVFYIEIEEVGSVAPGALPVNDLFQGSLVLEEGKLYSVLLWDESGDGLEAGSGRYMSRN